MSALESDGGDSKMRRLKGKCEREDDHVVMGWARQKDPASNPGATKAPSKLGENL